MFTLISLFRTDRSRACLLPLLFIFVLVGAQAKAQTIDIGPNQYAFQFTVSPNYGLFFNSTDQQYEFRNGAANPVFAFDAQNGRMKTNLEFDSSTDYLVPNNRYAFRARSNPNYGLYFNASAQSYEFRNNAAASVFGVSAVDGSINSSGNITASGAVSAAGGSSNQWNQAFNWGNHASAGYITSEADPKIGAIASNSLPVWNGSQLVTSPVTTGSDFAQIEAGNASLRLKSNGFLGGTAKLQFTNGTTQSGEIFSALGGMFYNNNSTIPVHSFQQEGTTRMIINADGKVGINSDGAANSELKINRNDPGGRGLDVEVNYEGFSDVRGVYSESITNDGYGVGIEGRGGYRGVYALGSGGGYTGTATGLYGIAMGSAGTRIGVYGTATGGDTRWAGYFASGNVYVSNDLRIGSTAGAAGYRVSVNGKIMCTELRVQTVSNWPDYVFSEDYALLPLDELEDFIRTEKHLPNIPSAAEMEEEEGFDVGDMQRLTLEKVEELTLYILELKRENEALKARIEAIEK